MSTDDPGGQRAALIMNSAVLTCPSSCCGESSKENMLFSSGTLITHPPEPFQQLGEDLSEPETELLVWTMEDTRSHPHAMTLGAALEASKDLYSDLQQKYLDVSCVLGLGELCWHNFGHNSGVVA